MTSLLSFVLLTKIDKIYLTLKVENLGTIDVNDLVKEKQKTKQHWTRAAWLHKSHPEFWKLEKESLFLSPNTPASNHLLHSGPPLWYQQGNEGMSHKLSLFELLAADSKWTVCDHPHKQTFVYM